MTTDPPHIGPLPPGLIPPRRAALSEQVADGIAEAISTGRIGPGERILESALVEVLGVSRVPIREALKVLHAQGILTGGANRGYRVAALDETVARQVMEVRIGLETLLLRDAVAAWRAGQGSPEVLAQPIRLMAEAAASGSQRDSLLADLAFHRAIRDAAPNPVAGSLWDTVARHVIIAFAFATFRTASLAETLQNHRTLRTWIERQLQLPATSAAEARQALEAHMRTPARPAPPDRDA